MPWTAADIPDLSGGGTRGYPTRAQATKAARDPELGALLWAVSEELTGVTYESRSV